ncbi:MAG: carboxypeptidase regulatory-like domain-containing protein [Gemmatimonadaceae bacterium]|nr:carboxypeptidase regulatory-like domain-containing protein [Gemmatimonadaceae bacterium]
MRLRVLLLVALLASPAAAQVADTARRAPGAVVSGELRDSIARTPLAGAIVQLVATDSFARLGRTSISDSLGRFVIADVPEGRYAIGFFHPMLDSLGVEAPLHEVRVAGRAAVRADLAIPSPVRLRAAICGAAGPGAAAPAAGVILGSVRDARDGTPLPGVAVIGEWLEVIFSGGRPVQRYPRITAITAANGWFALCNVPTGGAMTLTAVRGGDSTDVIDVDVPSDGFVRRELYLGAALVAVSADTLSRDSLPRLEASAPQQRRVRVGDGRIGGTVVTSLGGTPLAGAQVSIAGGAMSVSNERGEWALANTPVGTRMLEIRALGYYPERRRVDIVINTPAVHVALSTLKSVLDTVKVRAARQLVERDHSGFQERRHAGFGRFITEDDVARRQPLVTSELFRTVPGVFVEYDSTGTERRILMRSGFQTPRCSPAIFVDGLYLGGLTVEGGPPSGFTADDVDIAIRPSEVAGIEIYLEDSVPEPYQKGRSGCGVILIWAKPR